MAISWKDKEGNPTEEKKFIIDSVVKKKIHPVDLVDPFYKKFGKVVSVPTLRVMLADDKISIQGIQTKAKKTKKPKTIKQKVKADVEKHKLQQKLLEINRKYKMIVREESVADKMIRY